jgi:tetratricopeptide (TPR) repeat protein
VVDAQDVSAAQARAVDATEREWVLRISGQTNGWSPANTPSRLPKPGMPFSGQLPLPTAFLDWTLLVLDDTSAAAFDRTHPDFVPRLRDRFLAELDSGSAEFAHDLGLRLLELGPDDADVKVALAGFELDRGQITTTRELLEELSPSTRLRPDVRLTEARLLLRERQPREARDVLRGLLEQDPSNIEAMEILASVELAENRSRAATRVLREALQLQPERQDLREQLARALMDRRRYAEAEIEWERLRGLHTEPQRARSVLFNLALCLQREGRDSASIPIWDEYLGLEPRSERALFNLGLACQRTGDLSRAAEAWRGALEIDPEHGPSREHLMELPDSLRGDI